MNKCEWENGLLTCCDRLHKEITRSFQSMGKWERLVSRGYLNTCPHCEVRIDKPEQPIIKKSGGTWVARFEGIDYLCMTIFLNDDPDYTPSLMGLNTGKVSSHWKPISEIKITDEIAKLNPLVVTNAYETCHLIAISKNEIFIVSDINDGEWGCRTTEPRESLKRLATVSDLED